MAAASKRATQATKPRLAAAEREQPFGGKMASLKPCGKLQASKRLRGLNASTHGKMTGQSLKPDACGESLSSSCGRSMTSVVSGGIQW